MKRKLNIRNILIPALSAVAFGSISVGSTFALFTDKAETKIELGSGKVAITPTYENFKVYSANPETDTSKTLVTDERGGTYEIVEQSNGKFKNGGTATLTAATGEISILKATPGDRVTYSIKYTNESDVAILSRLVFSAENTAENLALLKGLEIKINFGGTEHSITGKRYYATNWTSVLPAVTDIGTANVDIYFPIQKGNEFQKLTSKFTIHFEVVQGNASVVDEAPISIE